MFYNENVRNYNRRFTLHLCKEITVLERWHNVHTRFLFWATASIATAVMWNIIGKRYPRPIKLFAETALQFVVASHKYCTSLYIYFCWFCCSWCCTLQWYEFQTVDKYDIFSVSLIKKKLHFNFALLINVFLRLLLHGCSKLV